jgi:hypothetical protein
VSRRLSFRSPDLAAFVLVVVADIAIKRDDCLSSTRCLMTPAERITAARVAELARQLTERERLVIGTLTRLRMVTSRDVQRLHFTEFTPLSNARSARRTLNQLHAVGVLDRLDRRVGGRGGGSDSEIWTLGLMGQHLVGRVGPAGGAGVRRPWTPAAAFLAHRLSISRLFVELVEAGRQGLGTLESFSAEPDCWRRYTGPGGQIVTLKPDASVITFRDDFELAWILEVDLGTETRSVLERKCQAVIDYYRSGREQARSGVFPWVAFSVPDERRRQAVCSVVERLPVSERAIFHVVLASETAAFLMRGVS